MESKQAKDLKGGDVIVFREGSVTEELTVVDTYDLDGETAIEYSRKVGRDEELEGCCVHERSTVIEVRSATG